MNSRHIKLKSPTVTNTPTISVLFNPHMHTLSILRIGPKREILGLTDWAIDMALSFLTQPNPSYAGSLDRIRYVHALHMLTPSDWTPPPITDLSHSFMQALVAPDSLRPLDLLSVHCFVHLDAPILNKWTHESQRVAAITALAMAPPGAWLLRRSSVKESDIITPRALCINDKRTGTTQHILIAHITGFGYAQLTGTQSFQQMPFSDGRAIPSPITEPISYMIPNPPFPTFQHLSGSLLDLLHRFSHMLDMDKMI